MCCNAELYKEREATWWGWSEELLWESMQKSIVSCRFENF